MIKKTYQWKLINISNDNTVVRYCHNCGKKVIFKDSKKKRHNANGKTIFVYAIYKCDKNHTWNMLLRSYKASSHTNHADVEGSTPETGYYDILSIAEHISDGFDEIEIILEEVAGNCRLDKLLGDRISDISRNKVCELIALGSITLDGKAAKQNALLKSHQVITILLHGFTAGNITR